MSFPAAVPRTHDRAPGGARDYRFTRAARCDVASFVAPGDPAGRVPTLEGWKDRGASDLALPNLSCGIPKNKLRALVSCAARPRPCRSTRRTNLLAWFKASRKVPARKVFAGASAEVAQQKMFMPNLTRIFHNPASDCQKPRVVGPGIVPCYGQLLSWKISA